MEKAGGNGILIEKELISIMAEVIGIQRERISPGDRLVEDLGLDSFAATELLVLAEKRFGITISDSDLMRNETVGEWSALIAKRRRELKNSAELNGDR